MKKRINVFCETAFYERHIESCPASAFPSDESIKKNEIWNNILKLLYNSDVWLDCSEEELNDKRMYNEYYMYLWKRSCSGQCGLECLDADFPRISTDILDYQDGDEVVYLNSLYLTNQSHAERAKELGVINISNSNYQDFLCLFKDGGIAIRKKEETDWNFLKSNANHNSNSMIIVDNYVLNRINKNLLSILDNLLPEKIQGVFSLSIFCQVTDEKKELKNLQDKVSKIRPHLKLEIELFNTKLVGKGNSEYFHDRAIVTNYMWIGSGAGFDIFEREYFHTIADKSTTVSVLYPFIQQDNIDWANEAYQNLLKDAIRCLKDQNKTSNNYLLKMPL